MTTLKQESKARSQKMLLWFAMISICMVFAGLTSGFVVSKTRPDWLSTIQLPNSFMISTVLLLISSGTFFLAKKCIQKNDKKQTTIYLISTLILGLAFVFFQFQGFEKLFQDGLVPTGETGNITISFLYAFVVVHIAHLFGGILSLIYVIYNHFKQKYNSSQTLGIELSAMYWHFMDFIWLYLFVFFYFYK